MKKYRASKLTLKVNDFDDYDFLNENHYQKWIASSIRYGLFDGDELIIEMTFGKPRYNKKYDWELLRLCTKVDCQVNGGASRLLKHFCEDYTGSIISYCNESRFEGSVYNALGFTKRGVCNSYHYEKDGISYNRVNFQKWKLLKQYPELNPDLTEKEIMTELLGYTLVEEKQATWSLGDKWYIYQITDKRNGKTYIGQHLDRCDDYWGSGTIIKREINKYGKESFEKTILVDNIMTQEEADKIELDLINKAKEEGKAEYNILTVKVPTIRHPGVNNGRRLSNEARAKISAKLKGNKNGHFRKNATPSEESREKNRMAHLGKVKSEATKIKLSETLKKKYSDGWAPTKGKKQSEESNQKRRESMKGKNSHLVECIETGEVHNKSEWGFLGYGKAYDVARGVRKSCKGLHFRYK